MIIPPPTCRAYKHLLMWKRAQFSISDITVSNSTKTISNYFIINLVFYLITLVTLSYNKVIFLFNTTCDSALLPTPSAHKQKNVTGAMFELFSKMRKKTGNCFVYSWLWRIPCEYCNGMVFLFVTKLVTKFLRVSVILWYQSFSIIQCFEN